MAEFSYRLVVLSHAAGGETLPGALEAFEARSAPSPTEVLVVVDGPEFGYATAALEGRFPGARATIHRSPVQEGFCAATNRAWTLGAAGPGPLYVAYLEHDFVLTRDVDWAEIAAVLDANPQLAQMQLMRDAVNEEEKAAGGLFESRLGQYEPQWENPVPRVEGALSAYDPGPPDWHEHRSYFTTNPSLMRRSFMQEHPWVADGRPECEGRYGLELVAAGFSFGVWGDGSPYARHVGVRSGRGY